MEESKICLSCGKDLSLANNFYDHPHPWDGKESICKACKCQRAKLNYHQKGKRRTPQGRKDRPRAFSFDPDMLSRIESTAKDLNLATFTEAINHILDTALEEKRYLTPNAFSRALSVLDKNLFELSIIQKNLIQINNAFGNGKAPNDDTTVQMITTLTNANTRSLTKLINLIRNIASAP